MAFSVLSVSYLICEAFPGFSALVIQFTLPTYSTSLLNLPIRRSKVTMSTRALLDPNDEEAAREQRDKSEDTDVASQLTLHNVPDPDCQFDGNAVAIWDHRYNSIAGFALYLQYCVTLGCGKYLRISA